MVTYSVISTWVSERLAEKPDSSAIKLLGVATATTVLYCTLIIIYRLFFHPLAKYPGPFLAKITDWYLAYFVFQGRATKTRYEWQKKYGEIVRVSPNELQFGDLASVKEIYGQSSLMPAKDPTFYHPFSVTGHPNILSSCDRAEHSRIRRLLSYAFSYSNVLNFEQRLSEKINTFTQIIGKTERPTDIYHLIHHLFLDTISDLSFDRSFDCLRGNSVDEAMDAERTLMITSMKGLIPFIEWVPLDFIQTAVKARPRLISFATACVRDLHARIMDNKVNQSSLLERMMKTKDDGDVLSEGELVENAIIFLQAGAGTSHLTLVYFIWHLEKNPHVRERLVDEIRTAFPDTGVMPDYKTLDALPYLDKVWTEVLRLQAPLAVNIPRVSPGRTIAGKYIPKGVKVANLAYYTQHHPSVYPDPWKFDPDRWNDPTSQMKSMHRPFSLGPRNCIGMHVAKVQIYLAVGAIYQRYNVTVDPVITEEMMMEEDRGILFPHRQKFLVQFKNRQ
ncbi:hypothetical protein LCI18_013202 [Fusarium solani-melongenae]|uniref:Uncharacterized protein n=1 Tax=Fusarium solani subsp. cucurbitae TaxID=2747967 RepID=A0ACD3ZMU8_FUSSC|nr:hypothetical protein LCI18_013202 [Fusarium solani-melongenae]